MQTKCVFSAINCTDPPFEVESNGLAIRNWTEEEGNPRPYATKIVYECTREGTILNENIHSYDYKHKARNQMEKRTLTNRIKYEDALLIT